MILVGNQRGGARDLALHLMKDENEEVVIHEIRGFASTTLREAFQESYAISRATKCRQHLFSLSLNPPKDAAVDLAVFEDAIERAEKQLGLDGQPRAIVFHEKRGLDGEIRRHAHAVWCRIDADTMTARQLSFTRHKLQELARELYLENEWQMPRGFIQHEARDPRNYTLAEWQQAKRAQKDPAKLKAMFQDCWAISDGRAAFAHALRERGYVLARGDRRGYVAVDRDGEVYAIARWVGVKTKQVRARLGPIEDMPDVETAHAEAAKSIADRLKELKAERQRSAREALKAGIAERRQRQAQNASEFDRLIAKQEHRAGRETRDRQARLRKGLFGLLDRLTGRRRRTLRENQTEAERAKHRDAAERNLLTEQHRAQLDMLRNRTSDRKQRFRDALDELAEDIRRYELPSDPAPGMAARNQAIDGEDRRRSRRRKRSRDGPTMEP